MKKRILSVFLAIVMLVSMIPMTGLIANAAIATGDYYGYYTNSKKSYTHDTFMESLCIVASNGNKAEDKWAAWDALEASLGSNYKILDHDLNEEAGGDYVYLGWTKTLDPYNAITGVKVLAHTDDNPPNTLTRDGVTWYLANAGAAGSVAPRLDNWAYGGAVDLNEDAGGDYLFLYVTKDQSYGPPLSSISASANEESPAAPGDGFEKVLNFNGNWQDVNDGAGGDYIYLMVGTDVEVINSKDIATLKETVSRMEKLVKAGGYNLSYDDYDYKYAKYNILGTQIDEKYFDGRDISQANVLGAISKLEEHLATATTTITFDANTNGGKIYNGNTWKSDYTIGENATVEVDVSGVIPEKSGYEFVGWNTDKNATTGSKTTVTTKPGATYYAIFRKKISVTFYFFDTNSAKIDTTVTGYLYNKNATVDINLPNEIPESIDIGFDTVKIQTLLGWRTDGEAAEPEYTGKTLKLGSDATLYGVYSYPVVLSFDTMGGNEIAPITEYQYFNVKESESSKVDFIMPDVETPPEGSSFIGWNISNDVWPSYAAGDTFSTYSDYTMYAYYNHSVAKVTFGDTVTYYDELQAALNAAMAGTQDNPGLVTLMQDVTIDFREEFDMVGHEWNSGVGVLDLNGHKLNHLEDVSVGRAAIIVYDGQLTIRDSATGGAIYSTDQGYNSGAMGVQGGSLILESGTIQSVNSQTNAVYIEDGRFTVNGGEVRNDNCGAISVFSSGDERRIPGTVNINGGKVSGGQMAILSGDFCNINITDGTVHGGYGAIIAENSERVAISGGTISSDRTPIQVEGTNYYYEVLNIVGETEISITGGTYKNRFAMVNNALDLSLQNLNTVLPIGYGFFDDDGELITLSADQTVIEQTVTVKMDEALIPHAHDNVIYDTEWSGAMPATTISTDTNIVLTDDVTFSGAITISNGATVNLCLNGKTMDMGTYSIFNNGTLTICDCTESGKITTNTNWDGVVTNKGVFYLTGGTLEDTGTYGLFNEGTATISGGTLYGKSSSIRNRSTGNLTITDGLISADGYALQTESTKDIIISGGEISGQLAIYNNGSGNIYISGGAIKGTQYSIHHGGTGSGTGTIYLSDGEITGTTGIYIYTTGSVEMTGGTITATKDYGIYNYSTGKVTVSGGSITGTKYGMLNNRTGSVEMTGGTVIGTSTTYAAICNDGGGSITISGGQITSKATGISAYGAGSVFFDGAQIDSEQSGISVYKGSLTVAGGTITGTGSNGITISETGTVTVSGGTITGKTYGIENKGTLYLSGSPSISRTSTGNGDIVHDKASIYAEDQNGVKYAGEALEIRVFYPSEGKEVILKVDDSNKDKFVLVNTSGGYVLKQSGENLVLGLPHVHSWATDWSSDDNAHWHVCTAEDCDITDYSQVAESGYAAHDYTVPQKDSTHHWNKCSDCGAIDEKIKHSATDDGDCTTEEKCSCGYVLIVAQAHSFDNACDTDCNNVGCEYTRTIEHTPEDDDDDCTTDILCSVCDAVTTKGNEAHTGGTATCTAKAKCSVCGTKYGEMLKHTYTVPQNDTSDHWNKCKDCDAIDTKVKHSGDDDGDCTTEVKCSCGYVLIAAQAHSFDNACDTDCNNVGCEYTRTIEHTPEDDDDDCTTDILCSVCDAVTTKGNEAHTGGTATCTAKAECSVCGTKYGEIDSTNHAYSSAWIMNSEEHYYECTRCFEKKEKAAHNYTNACDASCNVCGYEREIILDTSAVAATTIRSGYALEKSVITGNLNGVEGTWEWKNPETVVEETGTYTAVFTPADGTDPVEVELEVKACCFLCHSDNVFVQFVFSIFITVCKVFGLFRNCICGDVHYTESLFDLIVAFFNK